MVYTEIHFISLDCSQTSVALQLEIVTYNTIPFILTPYSEIVVIRSFISIPLSRLTMVLGIPMKVSDPGGDSAQTSLRNDKACHVSPPSSLPVTHACAFVDYRMGSVSVIYFTTLSIMEYVFGSCDTQYIIYLIYILYIYTIYMSVIYNISL